MPETASRTGGRRPSSANAGPPATRRRFPAMFPASTGSRPCASLAARPEADGRASERISAIDRLALRCEELARAEYDFLYDKGRHLLTIGYNVNERRRDAGYYDLLASEARLCTFVTIAQGQLPQEAWFALGRLLTAAGGEPILLSWSGSMFEYLMPLLVMPTYENTLIDRTCKAAVEPADRVREAARRAVGRVGIRLQPGRRPSQLPVPRVRGARPRAQAGAGVGPGRGAVRIRSLR